jgi:hypothetical protein
MESIQKDLSYDLASVDGLADLFNGVTGNVSTVTPDTESKTDLTATGIALWTLQETAQNLRISTRTVLRKLKTGALSGYKIPGDNGPEWRITPPAMEDSDNGSAPPFVRTVTPDNTSTPDQNPDTVTALLKVIESQAEQLREAAKTMSFQRQRLETQEQKLESKEQEIKLLTDRTHSWWAKFTHWFLGQK